MMRRFSLLKVTNKFAVILVLASVLAIIFQGAVFAEGQNWSWSAAEPIVFSENIVSRVSQTTCPHPYETIQVDYDINPLRACLTNGDDFSYGYIENNTFTSVVKYRFDIKYHKLSGICDSYKACIYTPYNDTLIFKKNISSPYVKSMVVYRNFSKHLSVMTSGFSLIYKFDNSYPDYIFQNESGYAWPVGALGISDNGEWLATEFYDNGIGLMNMDTLEMKKITSQIYKYDIGINPILNFAVSNDGESLAIMGLNGGLSIYDTYNCGDIPNDKNMEQSNLIIQLVSPCKLSPIDFNKEYMEYYLTGYGPKFDDEGGELTYYATYYYNTGKEPREITLQAAEYNPVRLDYLALGDSYSSGEGENEDTHYLAGTNEKYEKCHVSDRSYPFLLGQMQNMNMGLVKSVACSGAVTDDVVGDMTSYWGQGDRLSKNGLNMSSDDKRLAFTEAKFSFMQGRIKQEEFAKKYRPDVITIGIGGNDAGLVSKLSACVSPSTCDYASDPMRKEQVAKEIQAIFPKLVNTYLTLENDSPKSKIYAIGYPKIISKTGQCDLLNGILFDDVEKEFMDQTIIYINQMIAAAAKSAGIEYIDIADAFGDQALCGESSNKAMNGIVLGDDFSQFMISIGNESFHPTPTGHQLIADSINQQISNLMAYTYCGLDCKNLNVSAPLPSSYWYDVEHDYPDLRSVEFLADYGGEIDQVKSVSLDEYSLQPGSLVKIVITSDPIDLGDYLVNSDGSLNAIISLPDDLEEGFHTVHIYGTSYSGKSIELYQMIQRRKPVEVDKPVVQPEQDDNDQAEVSSSDNLSAETLSNTDDTSMDDVVNRAENDTDENIHMDANILGADITEDSLILDSKSASDNNPAELVNKLVDNKFWIVGAVLLAIIIALLLIFIVF